MELVRRLSQSIITQEIKFIMMLCGKVRETPDLIHIFLDSSREKELATLDLVYVSNHHYYRLS